MINLHIAHIDDDYPENFLMQEKIDGHTVKWFSNYDDYMKSNDDFDLIILDLNMPDYRHDRFKTLIKKEESPCIIYTTFPVNRFDSETLDEARRLGVSNFYKKGADDDKMYRHIDHFANKGEFPVDE